MTDTNCGAHNGQHSPTYFCDLPQGHVGRHRQRIGDGSVVTWPNLPSLIAEAAPPRATTPEPYRPPLESWTAAKVMAAADRIADDAERRRFLLDALKQGREGLRASLAAAPSEEIGKLLDDLIGSVPLVRNEPGGAEYFDNGGPWAMEKARARVEQYVAALSALASVDAREAERLREEVRELRFAGGQLANCAFNLAQNGVLDARTRDTLDACRKVWDGTVEKHVTARASLCATPHPEVTRFEVIDHRASAGEAVGRVYAVYGCRVELSYQDGGRTLKVFVDDPAATPPETTTQETKP